MQFISGKIRSINEPKRDVEMSGHASFYAKNAVPGACYRYSNSI